MMRLADADLSDASVAIASSPYDGNWSTPLQRATKRWVLKRAEYNAMVTFTFSKEGGVGYEEAKWIFGLFMRRFRDEIWGRRSNRNRRIPIVPVVEDYREQLQKRGNGVDAREGTHIHCLVAFPSEPLSYKDVVQRVWAGTHPWCGNPSVYCPDSDGWFVQISNDSLRRVYSGYILKRCRIDVDGLLLQYM